MKCTIGRKEEGFFFFFFGGGGQLNKVFFFFLQFFLFALSALSLLCYMIVILTPVLLGSVALYSLFFDCHDFSLYMGSCSQLVVVQNSSPPHLHVIRCHDAFG